MADSPLYQQIAAHIRQEILEGRLQPGERLPSVRQMTEQWGCTIGTVQHAYQELTRQGLAVSRPGQGTHVVKPPSVQAEASLRRARLVHRSEAFLLEVLTGGYTPTEVEAAVRQALERWQIMAALPEIPPGNVLRFAGSHDVLVTWLAAHFDEIVPNHSLQAGFCGSLGGLMALAQGQAALAGAHLWDEESDTYNEPFVRRLLPGRKTALLTLAHRRLGLILPPGNPRRVQNLAGLAGGGLRFVNRQVGSGTRVWLDAALRREGISAGDILGYDTVCMTHFDVAAAVAEGRADAGFGLETAAASYGLDFVDLVRERYDLAVLADGLEPGPLAALAAWLAGPEARRLIGGFTGYDPQEAGVVRMVE